MNVIINCNIRNQLGSNACQALRRENLIPATIYGPKMESIHIVITHKELERNKMHLSDNSIIDLTLSTEGLEESKHEKKQHKANKSADKSNSYQVIAKSFDLHPITDKITHVDFFFLTDNESKFKIPLVFLNRDTSPAIKLGGVLNIVKRKIAVKCKATALPHKIELDVKNYKVGDSIRIRDIILPEGVNHIIKDPNSAVATLIGKRAKVDKNKQETATTEEGDSAKSEAKTASTAKSTVTKAPAPKK